MTWYTYDDAGEPVWYQAAANAATAWRAPLFRYTWNDANRVATGATVGEVGLDFIDADHATFTWRNGTRSGSEPVEMLLKSTATPAPDHTGIYYDPGESGWGTSVYSTGDARAVLLYYYADDGSPRWALGVGDNRLDLESLAVDSYRGFCPDCARVEPVLTPAGRIDWNFASPRAPRADFLIDHASGDWLRNDVNLVPLADPPNDPRWR